MVRTNSFILFMGLGILAGCGGSSSSNLTGSTGDAGADASDDADQGDSSTDDAAADPLNAAATCTSNTMWTHGDRGSQLMHPGDTCVSCHASRGGPDLTIGGTVYPTGHEPTDCNGESGATTGLQVIITDAKGNVTRLAVNSVGNFYSEPPPFGPAIAFPITAKVVANGGKVREMIAPQTSGDCNSCHTQNGTNDAPGRITAPY